MVPKYLRKCQSLAFRREATVTGRARQRSKRRSPPAISTVASRGAPSRLPCRSGPARWIGTRAVAPGAACPCYPTLGVNAPRRTSSRISAELPHSSEHNHTIGKPSWTPQARPHRTAATGPLVTRLDSTHGSKRLWSTALVPGGSFGPGTTLAWITRFGKNCWG